jgi:hypothetical protein
MRTSLANGVAPRMITYVGVYAVTGEVFRQPS